MPFQIKKVKGGYEVSNILTGVIHAKHTTLPKAKKQLKILHWVEHAFKPR